MRNSFEYFYNDTVEVLEKTETGVYDTQTERKSLGTIKADVQPYNGKLALELYGYSMECDKRMYYDSCADVKVGSYILCAKVLYRIVYVTKRSMGSMALLKRCGEETEL